MALYSPPLHLPFPFFPPTPCLLLDSVLRYLTKWNMNAKYSKVAQTGTFYSKLVSPLLYFMDTHVCVLRA